MKRSCKLLALLLAILLLTASCGAQPAPGSAQPQSSQPQTSAEPEEGDTAPVVAGVDTEYPLEGDVIIAVNTSTDVEAQLPVGTLPSDLEAASDPEQMSQGQGMPLDTPPMEPVSFEPGLQIVGGDQVEQTYEIGQQKTIKTMDFYKRMMQSFGDPEFADYDTSERLDVDIELVYSGEYCTVWGQVSPIHNRPDIQVSLDEETAKRIADEFDQKIYPLIVNIYGPLYDVDKDGKFALVCADFVDYYNYEIYDNYYLQGYCNPTEDSATVEEGGNGTEMDMMVVDLWPTLFDENNNLVEENWTLAMQTISHEVTHYVNFSAQHLIPGKTQVLESWIQESFTTFSETLYKGAMASDIRGFYAEDANSVVANGRSPMQFQGMMEDYALVNFFSLYLYEQTKDLEGGGFALFRKMVESNDSDYRAIENALKEIGYPVTDFSELMFNFRVALIANEESGVYSFNRNENVQDLPVHLYRNGDGEADAKTLPAGGAIVFENVEGGFTPEGADDNIRFAAITFGE